jgi:hypothetical protein
MKIDQTAQTLAAIIGYAELLLGLPDDDLVAAFDLVAGGSDSLAFKRALTSLAEASDALAILLSGLRQARERLLAAAADRTKPN